MRIIAASDRRLVEDEIGFDIVAENLLDIDSGIDGATLKLRRFAIDGSVMLVVESYDDGIVAIALTKEQAKILGFWFSA